MGGGGGIWGSGLWDERGVSFVVHLPALGRRRRYDMRGVYRNVLTRFIRSAVLLWCGPSGGGVKRLCYVATVHRDGLFALSVYSVR